MSFRPTPAQAIGRGAYLGGVVGLPLCLVGLIVLAGWGRSGAWLTVVPVLAGTLLGAAVALVFGRQDGADIDDLGIHPTAGETFTPWQRIRDLRCERRRGRTWVVVDLDTGRTAWLHAPYHGRWLAADPEFERKLFMLRNLWETHRTFARDPREGRPGHGG